MSYLFKRILPLFLAAMLLCSLSGCGGEPLQSSSASSSSISSSSNTSSFESSISAAQGFHLAVEDYPVMDGSTANLPMMAQVMSEVCGIALEEAENLTSCAGTPSAWEGLVNGDYDILLVYEPAEATKQILDASGIELEKTPIGRDALVFIVNEGNPVENLTTQNLIDIYTGKTTNWKQLGGNDIEIVPYQRNETSGSQSLFMKLLMMDTTPMTAPTELQPGDMGMLIDELASYNNDANAIGYSVFYYASYMYTQPGLKFISVNGVMPSDESIADASYPFINEYFVVIRTDEPEESPARQLRDWIVSDAGIQAMLTAGYIPITD